MINPAIEEDLKRTSLNDVNYADYIKENYVPIEVLQEIRQEISEKAYSFQCMKRIDGEMVECEEKEVDLEDVLSIIDTHISALNNDQFERIWQNTVEEMKRRKINEI